VTEWSRALEIMLIVRIPLWYIYNILKIAELNCCQIIILSIYVPFTYA
jgi:hypothetical protein